MSVWGYKVYLRDHFRGGWGQIKKNRARVWQRNGTRRSLTFLVYSFGDENAIFLRVMLSVILNLRH